MGFPGIEARLGVEVVAGGGIFARVLFCIGIGSFGRTAGALTGIDTAGLGEMPGVAPDAGLTALCSGVAMGVTGLGGSVVFRAL